MVERIRLLLSRFSEDEGTVRRMVATDPSFDALCHDYRKVIDLLDRFESEVERLRKATEYAAISNNEDAGDISTLANPEIVDEIRNMKP